MTRDLVALYGTDEPLPEEVRLTAGALEATLVGGALRGIKLQGVEVIRGLHFLVRDRNWATMVPEIRNQRIEQRGTSFKVTFEAEGKTPSDGIGLVWKATITGSARDGIVFEAEATPQTELLTARTGFIVLHPLDRVVGCPVTLERGDGRIDEARFPDLVDPLQPFLNVRAMTHEPIPGIRATCRMEGADPFECEDHRNWLDASFKTYYRPLGLPWPYTLPAGQPVRQRIVLTFSPSVENLAPLPAEAAVTVAVGDRTGGAMPQIGLAVTADELAGSQAVAGAAAGVGAQTLAVRVSAATKDLPGVLRAAAELAAALKASPALEIVLPLEQPYKVELDLVAVAAASAGFVPACVTVSPGVDLKSYPPSVDRPPSPPLALIYAAARNTFPGIPLGGGMFSYFTELNRRRPPVQHLDFVQHATAAIVHAADDQSVMETLEALPHVFRSMRAIAGPVPYRVGPANIAMGFNPYGASTSPNPDNLKRTMVTDDPRQGAQFAAAWAAGYLARAVAGNLAGVTMMAPAGPFGVCGEDGAPRPAFHVLQSFAAGAGSAVRACASSDPQRLLACACEKDGRVFVWLANLTAAPLPVRLAGVRPVQTRVLAGGKLAAGDVAELPPYGVAFVTG